MFRPDTGEQDTQQPFLHADTTSDGYRARVAAIRATGDADPSVTADITKGVLALWYQAHGYPFPASREELEADLDSRNVLVADCYHRAMYGERALVRARSIDQILNFVQLLEAMNEIGA